MRVILSFLAVAVVLGCLGAERCSEGYVLSGSDCCLDENRNGVCDDQEMEKLVLVVNPAEPTCDDEVKNQGEEGIDCGGPCSPCESGTEKPAETGHDAEATNRSMAGDTQGLASGNGSVGERTAGSEGGGTPGVQGNASIEDIGLPGYEAGYNRTIQNLSWVEPYIEEGFNSSFCVESVIRLTDTAQDGYVGDETKPPDGTGDRVGLSGYNMVGDIDDRRNFTADDQYKIIVAFPIAGLTGNVSNARVNVLPYVSQGTVLDTQLEHIICSGTIGKADYSSPSDGYIGVIVKASAPDEMMYDTDVTEYLLGDIESNRAFSCYRLYWNQSGLDGLNNERFDRRVFYSYGSEYAPFLTYVKRPCTRCEMNRDCGKTDYVRNYECNDNRIIRQYVHHRCADPGTDAARCVITQEAEEVDTCNEGELCTDGEDRCFPETCYDRDNDTKEQGVDCGGHCRACHCFNGRKDAEQVGFGEAEEGVDCGGECRPCVVDRRLPFVKIVSPSGGGTYGSRMIQLRYSVNKEGLECWFSLNGGLDSTLAGSREFKAAEGRNNLTVTCNDSFGKVGSDYVSFRMEPTESMACPSDSVGGVYKAHFDEVTSFMDVTPKSRPPMVCNSGVFHYITSQNESVPHFMGPYNITGTLGDGNLTDYRFAAVSYNCSVGSAISSGYVHAVKNMASQGKVSVILYFHEILPPAPNLPWTPAQTGNLTRFFPDIFELLMGNPAGVNATNAYMYGGNVSRAYHNLTSYWRFYPYNLDGESVDYAEPLDVPYSPKDSGCERDYGIKYQEIDLTPLVRGGDAGARRLEVRMAFYSNGTDASLGLVEAELSVR